MASDPMPPISSSTTVDKDNIARRGDADLLQNLDRHQHAGDPALHVDRSATSHEAFRNDSAKGSLIQCSGAPGGTTSIWPVNMMERPSPLPFRTPARLGRPSKVRPLLAPGRPSYLAKSAGPSGSLRSVVKPS